MNSFHILCIFLFDFSLSLLIAPSPSLPTGDSQRVFIAPLLSSIPHIHSYRACAAHDIFVSVAFFPHSSLTRAHTRRSPPQHHPSQHTAPRASAGNDRRCLRSLNATDCCCSRDLARRAAVRSPGRLGSARLKALSSGFASCLCGRCRPGRLAGSGASGDRQADYGNKQSVFAFSPNAVFSAL